MQCISFRPYSAFLCMHIHRTSIKPFVWIFSTNHPQLKQHTCVTCMWHVCAKAKTCVASFHTIGIYTYMQWIEKCDLTIQGIGYFQNYLMHSTRKVKTLPSLLASVKGVSIHWSGWLDWIIALVIFFFVPVLYSVLEIIYIFY